MLDPYDPPHPDGPVDDDAPIPIFTDSWVDDVDPAEPEPRSKFFLVAEDPE